MSYNKDALPTGKVDAKPATGPANQGVTSAEWNGVMGVLDSVRTVAYATASAQNVKAFLVGDGSSPADCFQAVNAAIAAAAGSGCKHIHFPAGTYIFDLSSITPGDSSQRLFTIPSGFTVSGDGSSSILKMIGIVGDADAYGVPGDTGRNLFGLAINSSGIRIHHLHFVGENGVGPTGYVWKENNQSSAIDFTIDFTGSPAGGYIYDAVIEDCEFDNMHGFSIHCQGFCYRARILRNTTRYCANGINVNGNGTMQNDNVLVASEGFECTGPNNTFNGNLILDCYTAGFSIGGEQVPGTIYRGNVVSNNVINGVSKPGVGSIGEGILISDATVGATISNNVITRCTGFGIIATVTLPSGGINGWHTIVGNTIQGTGGGPAQSGINIAASGNCLIQGNVILNVSDQPSFGFNAGVALSSGGNTVIGNTLGGSGYGVAISDGVGDNSNYIGHDNLYPQSAYHVYWGGHQNSYRVAYGYDGTDIKSANYIRTWVFPHFTEHYDGKHEWGDGYTGPIDTNLYRSAPATLKTDSKFVAPTVVIVPSAAPAGPVEGQLYMNSTDHKLYVYNGTSWVVVGSQT